MGEAVKAEKPGGVCGSEGVTQSHSIWKAAGRLAGACRDEGTGFAVRRRGMEGAGRGAPSQRPPPPCPQDLKTVVSVAEPPTGDLGLTSQRVLQESQPLLGASPGGGPSSPRDLPEPRVTTENTNNRIGESAHLGFLAWSG